jgi:N-acetylneuraminic acid mutarotase
MADNWNNNDNLRNKNVNRFTEVKETINEEDNNEESSNGPSYQVVCNIVPPGKQVVLYNVDKDTIIRKNLEFTKFAGISHFLDECSWVNHNNKLYILGGTDDFNKPSKIFLEYDPIKNSIRRLPDSQFSHSRHNLFSYNNQIFVVGGDRLECEKYDIINNEWSSLPNLSFKQIYPVLYVHNDILYSFFGIDENIKKTDNAQKLNLKNSRSKWTRLTYKRNDCNLCVYGCGIAKTDENCIMFLGGMDDNGIRNDAIQFDFSNLSATKTNYQLEEKAFFKDSVLLKLNSKDYGNFSIEETNPFLKIKF